MNKLIALFAFLILAGCAGRTVVEKTTSGGVFVFCDDTVNETVIEFTDCVDFEVTEETFVCRHPDGTINGAPRRTSCSEPDIVVVCQDGSQGLDDPADCPPVPPTYVCETTGEEVSFPSDCPESRLPGVHVTVIGPASQTMARGADSVDFTFVRFEAIGGNYPLNVLTFRLDGVGSTDNIEETFLYRMYGDIGFRESDAAFISPASREVSFAASTIEDGQQVTYALKANVSPTANGGDTARFDLLSVETDGRVFVENSNGAFPLRGNTMSFGAVDAGTIHISNFGPGNPTVGEEDAVLAKFTARPTGENAWLKQITLHSPEALVRTQDAGAFGAYRLWYDNLLDGEPYNKIADCRTISDVLILCPLDQTLFLEQDAPFQIFELRTDIAGEDGDVTRIAIEEEADVVANGDTWGFNMAVDISEYDEVGDDCTGFVRDCSYSLIEDGCQFTVDGGFGTMFQTRALPSFFPRGGEATEAVIPGPNTALEFGSHAQNACGGDLTMYWLSDFDIRATDKDGTGWVENLHDNAPALIRLVNLTTGIETPATVVSFGPTGHLGTTTYFGFGFDFDPDMFMESGAYHDYEVIVDTTGASADSDDSLEVSTMFEAYWTDGEVSLITKNLGPHIGTVLIH